MQVPHSRKLCKDDPMNSIPLAACRVMGPMLPSVLQQSEGETDWLSDACDIIGLWCNEVMLGGTG
jgi:hypothetical protein